MQLLFNKSEVWLGSKFINIQKQWYKW